MPERYECSVDGTDRRALETAARMKAREHFKERPFYLVQSTPFVEISDFGSKVRKFMASYLFEEGSGN